MTEHNLSPFERIRQHDDSGHEYWSARALAKVLGYSRFNKFLPVIAKAETACRNSGYNVDEHLHHTVQMITIGRGAKREFDDVRLTRYGCYLIVQNADPGKEIVALGQTYFAVQTRRQELADNPELSAEDYKRLAYRDLLDIFTLRLAEQAAKAGVVEAEDFSIFQDHGYLGLYGGLTAEDIHKIKELAEGQNIEDFMDIEELGSNIFRSSQTRNKLERDNITDKQLANLTHYQVGEAIRNTIAGLKNTMPENLPKPGSSIQELKEREQLKKLPQPEDS